jgi:hypothetical protein
MADHVSLGFAQLSNAALSNFSVGVYNGLTANAATFTAPTITPATLKTAQQVLDSAEAATNGGGEMQTIARDHAHDALVSLLRQEANYVQGVAQGDAGIIMLAGFQVATAGYHPQSALGKPVINKILNEASTQLVLRLQPMANAHAFEVQISTTPNAWQPAGMFTQARRIVVTGLTPGVTYTLRVRAIGGSTGYSDWSDPVSHMAM